MQLPCLGDTSVHLRCLSIQKGLTSKEGQRHRNECNQHNVHSPVNQPGEEPVWDPAFGQLDQLILNHVIDWHCVNLQTTKAHNGHGRDCQTRYSRQMYAALASSSQYGKEVS